MKPSVISLAAIGTALVGASLLVSTAAAGPGLAAWQQDASRSVATMATTSPAHRCAGADRVTLTALKPAWPNGRGPAEERPVGPGMVCRTCPVTKVSVEAWPNGRGPVTQTAVTRVGVDHGCSSCCSAPSQ